MAIDEAKIAELQARIKARDDLIRESWVRTMEARIVNEELIKCQRTEGVNHYQSCRELAEKYASMLKENKVKGYKQIDL